LPETSHRSRPGRRFGPTNFWVACALITLTVAVFAPVRAFDFVSFDDPWYVGNGHVVTGLTPRGVLWAFTSGDLFYWQPLTWLSHMTDVQLFGTHAGGHHVTNLLLHLASTVVLFALLRKITGAAGPSALVAALFAVHPLRVESVAWIAERKDVLSTLLCLLTVWVYVGYVRRITRPALPALPAPPARPALWRSRQYLLVVLLFALALMAKPMVVTLPVMLLLVDIWPLGRLGAGSVEQRKPVSKAPATAVRRPPRGVAPAAESRGRSKDQGPAHGARGQGPGTSLVSLLAEKVPLFVMAGACALATILVQASVGAMGNEMRAVSLDYRVANTIVSYVAYLRMLVWPDRLAAFYPYPATLPSWELVAGCAAALVLVSVAAVSWRRSAPYLLVGWFWYIATLFPVSGLFQAGDQLRADRFTYVPSIGIFLMVAWGIAQLVRGHRLWQRASAVAAVIVVAACGIAAHAQVRHWQNSETLWKRALAVTEGNHRAHASLAEVYAGQGRLDEAIAEYRAALRILPDVADWRNALGLLYLRQNRLAEAAGQFAIAARLRPGFADAHTNLGAVLARAGRAKEAIAQYEEAARLTPNDASTRFNLSVVLQADGRTDEALAECLQALRLDPSKPDWHYQAAYLYSVKGNKVETRRYLEETLRLDPNHQAARSALATLGLLK